jgi:anti-sigma regulatory factor (Ser/Thr protein kinase)
VGLPLRQFQGLGVFAGGRDSRVNTRQSSSADTRAASTSAGNADKRAEIVLAPVPESLSAARSFVASLLDQWDCEDPDEVVALLTSEIVSNAVRHASGAIGLQVEMVNDHELSVRARDEAPEAPVERRLNPGGAGGHGLHIVETLSRRWGVERFDEYKVVWFEAPVSSRHCGS